MDAEFGSGTVQVEDELVHAHAAGHTVQARAFRGHHAHRAAGLGHMLGAFHVESGGGAVDAVRISERHDRGGGVGRGQIRAAVGNAMAGLHILDGAELRLQGHGGLQAIRGRRAHGRIGFVTVQADARTGQFEVDFRTGQRRRGCWRGGGFPAECRPPPYDEVKSLNVSTCMSVEATNSGTSGASATARWPPLADDVQHAFLGERHQFGERRVETGGRGVTAEAGIDLHMHARRLAEPACGRGDAVDAGERADGNVDVVVDQLVERHFGAAVDPRQNRQRSGPMPPLRSSSASCDCAVPSHVAPPASAASGRNQTVAVRVGFDDAHDGGAGMRTADDTHQMAHVVAQCGESTMACAGYRRWAAL